jgi:dimethylpropiothetin dethiomethylase
VTRRLLDAPDWVYLLREFDAIYRFGYAGGSRAIRAHRRRVREAISDVFEANRQLVDRQATTKPVVEHLPRALDLGSRGVLDGLSRTLGRLADQLTWEYGYERVRKPLARKYAFCEILGPRGPIQAEQLILGLVLFAPRMTYPQHRHQGIEESYVSVAGAWSENDAAVYAPGSLVLNCAGHEHRITTGDYEPCLLAYAWTGPATRLAAPEMKFSAPTK